MSRSQGESRLRRFLDATVGTAGDAVRGIRRESFRQPWKEELAAIPRIALGTLPWLTRSLAGGTLLDAALRNAKARPQALAFVMDDERLHWRALVEDTSRIAHVLHEAGVRPGDVIALLGPTAPRYISTVLGIARAGATAALINTHLRGRPLAHALRASRASRVVVHRSHVAALADVVPPGMPLLVYGEGAVVSGDDPLDFDEALSRVSPEPFAQSGPGAFRALRERTRTWMRSTDGDPPSANGDGDYVYIYTSGTTGLPKPCRISHGRALMAAAGFGEVVMELGHDDVVYSPLPLYHASGLMIGAGACITAGATMALRDGFSAAAYWDDVRRYDATALLYIGELCRYLVAVPARSTDRNHRVRIAVGNGLRPDVWPLFQERFGIPQIREFYAATEAPGFIVNLEGACGRRGSCTVASQRLATPRALRRRIGPAPARWRRVPDRLRGSTSRESC